MNVAFTTHRQPRRETGLTLVETMVTLAVAAILLTAAVPPMQDFIVRNQMSTEVNSLVGSMYLARSEAVKRLQNVVVCPTTDSVNCAPATDWTPGWMVFSDPNNDGVVDDSDVILQQDVKLPSRFMATGANSSCVVFSPTGALASCPVGGGFGNTTVTFLDCNGVANTTTLTLSQDGHIFTTQLTPSSGCSSP